MWIHPMSLVYANIFMSGCVRACVHGCFGCTVPHAMEEQRLYWMVLPCINIFEKTKQQQQQQKQQMNKKIESVSRGDSFHHS